VDLRGVVPDSSDSTARPSRWPTLRDGSRAPFSAELWKLGPPIALLPRFVILPDDWFQPLRSASSCSQAASWRGR
jgi:hypothetical protein